MTASTAPLLGRYLQNKTITSSLSIFSLSAVSAGDGVLFDNPIYETGEGGGGGGGGGGKKKGAKGSPNKDATRAHEMETIAILRLKNVSINYSLPSDILSLSLSHRPSVGHYEPVDYAETSSSTSGPEKKTPILDEYERL